MKDGNHCVFLHLRVNFKLMTALGCVTIAVGLNWM